MKKVNRWRLPLGAAVGKNAFKAGTSGDTPDNVFMRMPQSSGLHRSEHGRDVEQVIAKALSSAGLTSLHYTGSPTNVVTPGIFCAPAPTGAQVPRWNRQSEGGSSDTGQFLEGSFRNAAGTRSYKLYVPSVYAPGNTPVPLIVMLHGCTQSPDDFAMGTQMNQLAESYGFLVLYPAQSPNANGSNCWNWFRAEDQQRDCGEPSLIAGITRHIVSTYRVDPESVFVAGLSAGAAMAVVLGATYPDVFAAVGAHSGLAYGAAHDVPSAFAAMKGADARMRRPSSPRQSLRKGVPTIVFHGDHDSTVDVGNGKAIISEAIDAYRGVKLRSVDHPCGSYGERKCSRIVHVDADNRPLVEQWILHGAGHAWSGGDARGSYTDVRGLPASDEMVRFFYAQRTSTKRA